jgi:tetraacyldisaccharide 4'-kinase
MGRMMVRLWKGEAPLLRSLLFLPLSLLAGIYRLALAARGLAYAAGLKRVVQPRIPVVSVGNLSLGGTGKTTVVERLSTELKRRGFTPGIVMRGYKKKRPGTFAVDPLRDTAVSAGDEAFMLATRTMLPVVVGKTRHEGIDTGMREFAIDVAIFDDGFQVRSVKKDVEILVVNGQEPGSAMHLFPLGFLREPLEMLRKADILLVNKGELSTDIRELAAGIPAFHVRYRPLHLFNVKRRATVDYRYVAGKKTVAFSGLGDNMSFFRLLEQIGAELVATVEFPDHHRYRVDDLRRIESLGDADIMVTTEKDAVKIGRAEAAENLFYLAVEAQIDDEERLVDLVVEKMRG